MSRLDVSTHEVLVYLQETGTDRDGNLITRPSTVGIPAKCRIQRIGQSGTSARRAEQDNEGFGTEEMYRLVFTRDFPYELGPQSRIDWDGRYWAIFGKPHRYNSSSRTRRVEYVMMRN